MVNKLKDILEQLEPQTIKLRHNLHQHPELSLHEKNTSILIREKIEILGLPYEMVGEYGVVARLECGEGKTVLLRADMDALPVSESKTNLEFSKTAVSKVEGVSHACGHDAHMAMLLSSMEALCAIKEQLNGTVLFCFEQAEELGLGVMPMMKTLSKYKIDTAWALHVYAELESGKISVDSGSRMAGIAAFDIKLTGKGGHISRPDLCQNPILCATQIISNLNTLWASKINPTKTVTLGIGTFHSGEKSNIIPETAQFAGSLRYFDAVEGIKAYKEFKRVVQSISDLYHCSVTYVKDMEAPYIVVNDAVCSNLAKEAIEEVLGTGIVQSCDSWLATESMAVYLNKYPGILAFLGIKNTELGTGAGHHTPQFDVDDSVLKLGVAATVIYTIKYLG